MRDPAPREKRPSLSFNAITAAFRVGGMIAPALAARKAAELFRKPPQRAASDPERALLATGTRRFLPLSDGEIATWTWGSGPSVFLVHGWGSRGARLGSFVEPITAAGFQAITYDAPAHGDSSGRLSSLPQFLQALLAVAKVYGPARAIVAHSMGGSAATLAMARGVSAGRVVFLAPAANPRSYTKRFAAMLGISERVRRLMELELEQQLKFRWEDLDVPRAAKSLTTPLLVFHDRDDGEVDFAQGKAIVAAWRGARLVETRGLGHTRIVQDPVVVSEAMEFVTAT